jgi:CBS domain-containing protein
MSTTATAGPVFPCGAVSLNRVTEPSRVFAARLAGLTVFGPDAGAIGRVRDVVAVARTAGPLRVLGLVVEVVTRRPIFVPMLRVSRIEANAVTLATGSVNLRRFDQRSNELLVLGQLLGAKVTVRSVGAAAVLVDAALQRTRTRDWEIGALAIRGRTGRLGRRGPVEILPAAEVDLPAVAGTPGHREARLPAAFDTMRAVDIASTLHDLPRERRHAIAEALDDERLADVIEELPDKDQETLLTHLDDHRAAHVLEAMNPDDAADLLAELSDADKDRLLALMEPRESEPVKRLLAYSADTAGGLMTPEPVAVGPDATIAEALALVRDPELPVALASMVFVCRPPWATPTGRYLGCVHLQRLLREPPSHPVSSALDTDLASLQPGAPLTEITRYFAAYNLVCGPVLDDGGHLLGAVTVDDVLDHMLPDNWRESGLPDTDESAASVGQEHIDHA